MSLELEALVTEITHEQTIGKSANSAKVGDDIVMMRKPGNRDLKEELPTEDGGKQENVTGHTLANPKIGELSPSNATAVEAQSQTGEEAKPLSKNAQKRLLKKKLWEAQKAERRALKKRREKEKKIARMAAKAAEKEAAIQHEREEAGEGRRLVIDAENRDPNEQVDVPPTASAGQKRRRGGNESNTCNQSKKKKLHEQMTFLIDCGFDDFMTDKEITSLSSQITRCYSDNRNARHCVTMKITSFNKRLKDRFNNSLHGQYKNWKGVQFSEEEYKVSDQDIMSGSLIYLTSDSECTLDNLEKGKTYIIGGIVDRNRHKGICYKKATEQGLKTAKLPIGEYIRMSSRFVLTTNQVMEIMLRWLECRDWKEAFLKVIPQRKQPKAIDEGADPEEEEAEVQEGIEEDGDKGTGLKDKILSDFNGIEPANSSGKATPAKTEHNDIRHSPTPKQA